MAFIEYYLSIFFNETIQLHSTSSNSSLGINANISSRKCGQIFEKLLLQLDVLVLIIPALWRLKQEDLKSQAGLDYMKAYMKDNNKQFKHVRIYNYLTFVDYIYFL